jgi:hypothetical protein
MVRTHGTGTFTESVTVITGSVTAPIGRFSQSLTISGAAVMTTLAGTREQENLYFAQTISGAVTLVQKAKYPYRILDFTAQTASGTASGTLTVGGVIVGGISDRVWNTTEITSTATSNNAVSTGSRVQLLLSGTSNFTGFGATYLTERV